MIYKAFIKCMALLTLAVALSGCITGLAGIPSEQGKVDAYFCSRINCSELFINASEDAPLLCAMYHPSKQIAGLAHTLVVDESHPWPGAVVESGAGLMHNKFCIFGNNVWTGSWNPSQGMSIPNNVVIIESPTIANAYIAEFEELHAGIFHGGSSQPAQVFLNGSLVEVYFCPEDACKEQVIRTLKGAERSIHFMTFSFTDDDIGNLVKSKAKQGISVKGIFDPRKNKYSEYEKLKEYSTVEKVHHKVFIIDEKIVITGSYNPSKNANERNDENLVIIHDGLVAAEFMNEFKRVTTNK